MKLFFAFCLSLGLASLVHAQCLDEYPIHEIFSAGGSKTYSTYGSRVLTASVVNVNDCPEDPNNPTGTAETDNTIISYNTTLRTATTSTGKCRVNNSTGQSHWYTFAGIKVEADGWKIQPQDLELLNIDVEPAPSGGGSGNQETLRKVSVVFGYNGQNLVWPQYTIPQGSLLRTQEMRIETNQMTMLGFPTAGMVFPYGVMWGQLEPEVVPNYLVDCTSDQTQCRAIASFTEPIDGFFVLFAGENKSATVTEASMSVGPLKTTCGCRCDMSPANGDRVITTPVAPNECTKTLSQSGHLYCSDPGPNWCERAAKTTYESTGPAMAGSGNYPCRTVVKPYAVQVISPYSGP